MEEPEWRTGTLKGDDRKNGEKESKVRSGPEGVERGSKSEKRMIEAQKKRKEREIQAEGGREEMWRAAMETVETPPPAF